MQDAVEVQVAQTAALALHAQALLERMRSGPATPTGAANQARLEQAVARAQLVLAQLAGPARAAVPARP